MDLEDLRSAFGSLEKCDQWVSKVGRGRRVDHDRRNERPTSPLLNSHRRRRAQIEY